MIPLTLATEWSWDGFLASLGWVIIAFIVGGLFGRQIFRWIKNGLTKALGD